MVDWLTSRVSNSIQTDPMVDTLTSSVDPMDMLTLNVSNSVQMDLGAADVHQPAAEERDMSISAAKRKSLPEKQFALPAQRKYPLDTAARTRNAAARLEQMKKRGKVSDSDYKSARARIAAAAKKFGIESEYNESDKADGRSRPKNSIHVRADLAPGGSLHVRHMSDGSDVVYFPPVGLPAESA